MPRTSPRAISPARRHVSAKSAPFRNRSEPSARFSAGPEPKIRVGATHRPRDCDLDLTIGRGRRSARGVFSGSDIARIIKSRRQAAAQPVTCEQQNSSVKKGYYLEALAGLGRHVAGQSGKSPRELAACARRAQLDAAAQ